MQALERKDREAAERLSAGIKVPRRKRNQDKVGVALDLVHRRVPGKESDASIGVCYRTMAEDEYIESGRTALAEDHYVRLTARDTISNKAA